MNYLADSHISFALQVDAATKEIFKKLDDIYDRRSMPIQWAIKRKIDALKFDSSASSLLVHFEKFNGLITNLSTAKGEEIKEADVIGNLLRSIPAEYEVVMLIETMNDSTEINLAFVKNKLLDYETKLKEVKNDTSSKATKIGK